MLGLESTFGVISACIPTIGPIYYRLIGKSLDPTTGPSAGANDAQGHALVTFGRLPASRQKRTYDTLGSIKSQSDAESQTQLHPHAASEVAA